MEHLEGISSKVQAEIINLAQKIGKMVVRNNDKDEIGTHAVTGEKMIFKSKPCFTLDNFFSGEFSLNFLGRNGYGGVFTCARNCLPKGVNKEAFHHLKTDASQKIKVARFYEPIVAVKKYLSSNNNSNNYERVHVSFQSTSSCNISTVNALSSCSFFTREKERGVGENKRHIEMNEVRQPYLKSYFRVDNIDSLLGKCKMYYRSWKYWHMVMLHTKNSNNSFILTLH